MVGVKVQQVLRSQESYIMCPLIFGENLKTQVMQIFAHDLQFRSDYLMYTQTDNKNPDVLMIILCMGC